MASRKSRRDTQKKDKAEARSRGEIEESRQKAVAKVRRKAKGKVKLGKEIGGEFGRVMTAVGKSVLKKNPPRQKKKK